MPKRLLKRWLPEHNKIKNHKHLRIFGKLLHDPNLWHLNRRSVSRACAIGLFCAFMPIPFQMVLAAAIAIALSANLPISVVLVWVSNPITMPPIFYFAYKLGAWLLHQPYQTIQFAFSADWLEHQLSIIWQPLLAGLLLCAIISSIIGYFLIRIIWRIYIYLHWRTRHKRRG